MGRRGPQKKLAAIKRLECNPGCYPIEESGVAGLGEPFIPEHLPDDARGCIDVIKVSMPPGVYSALDSFLLSAFAMAWAIHKKAAHEIGGPQFQWTTASKRGSPQASPWIRIANQQAQMLASLGDRLGLDRRAAPRSNCPTRGNRGPSSKG